MPKLADVMGFHLLSNYLRWIHQMLNRAIRCKSICFNRIPSSLFEWNFSFLLPDWKLVLQVGYTQKLMHCILNDCNSEECKKTKTSWMVQKSFRNGRKYDGCGLHRRIQFQLTFGLSCWKILGRKKCQQICFNKKG